MNGRDPDDGTTNVERHDMRTGALLKNGILGELAWCPVAKSTHVGVIVKDGVAALTGKLSSDADPARHP